MSSWTDFIAEPTDDAFTQKVFRGVRPELERYRKESRRSWLFTGLGFAAAALAGVTFNQLFRTSKDDPSETGLVALVDLEQNDFELIRDLELIEDLEVIEQWEET